LKKRITLFIIPFVLILTAFYSLNHLTKDKIRKQSEQITIAEGMTIETLIEVSGHHLTDDGEHTLITFLDNLYQNDLVVYIGLFKDEELIHLLSRFEGYFPVVENQEEDLHVIDSPIGKIFDIKGSFENKNGTPFRLHIGFKYDFLSTFERTMSRNFLIVAGLFSIILLFITGLVIYFDKKIFQKELELERETQEKERFKELSLLTSEIAHEIKNPLNSIYLSFNELEKYLGTDENAVFYRDAVKGEIKRITAILQSYSDLSRKIEPHIETVDLAKLAAEFEWMMEGELKRHNATLGCRAEGHEEGKILFDTDRDLLKQVLLNMVKNAVEAGADDVELTFGVNKKGLLLTVKDNGKGIDEAAAADIFKPYVSSKTKGMGLGLHIVMKILKALNGDIQLISRSPGNTVFRIGIFAASGGPNPIF
jgi:signal transduction histidine kinase